MAKVRTTVYLDDSDYRRLKLLAEREGRSAAELIRAAVRARLEGSDTPGVPRSIGLGHSGVRDLGTRSEEHLDGFGES